jgi:hypothetical protein
MNDEYMIEIIKELEAIGGKKEFGDYDLYIHMPNGGYYQITHLFNDEPGIENDHYLLFFREDGGEPINLTTQLHQIMEAFNG